MQAFEVRVVITAALQLVAAVSGVVVVALGRPLNVAVSTLHKLLALAATVFAVLVAIDVVRALNVALRAVHAAVPFLALGSVLLLAYLKLRRVA